MPLDPQCKTFLDQLAALGGPPIEKMTAEQARQRTLADFGIPVEEVAHVENRTVPGPAGPIPVRVYTPVKADVLPALVFFHGGGWVLGDLDSHDRECRTLANQSGCVVIAVDYRLAPEHKFPAAADDCYAATRYVAEHPEEFGVDARRIAVGGDSAGGNLATVVALMLRERGGPALAYQLLIYPCTDMEAHEGSMKDFADGYFLTTPGMEWFNASYTSTPEDRRHPYVSPAYADVSGLPPAMVMTAECDPLRDQGEAYARKLADAGVPVVMKRYDGMFHPFFSLGGVIDAARTAHSDAAAELRRALGRAI